MTAIARTGLGRRMASAIYELLMVLALVFIATFPYLAVLGDSTQGWSRHLLQAWVLAVCGAYFVWFWSRGGQTLPMKTWRIRVVRFDGAPLGAGRALHRYGLWCWARRSGRPRARLGTCRSGPAVPCTTVSQARRCRG